MVMFLMKAIADGRKAYGIAKRDKVVFTSFVRQEAVAP